MAMANKSIRLVVLLCLRLHDPYFIGSIDPNILDVAESLLLYISNDPKDWYGGLELGI